MPEEILISRQKIDEIDDSILKLLSTRQELVQKIGKIKKQFSIPTLQAKRWEEIMLRLDKLADQQNLSSDLINVIWNRIHQESLNIESTNQIQVYFLGPEGSFSHQVALKYFANEKLIPCKSFQEISQRVDKYSVAILPIENKISGQVMDATHAIKNEGLVKINEYKLPVSLCLMGNRSATLDSVKEVYSKDAALKQCQNFITNYQFKQVESDSTAASALQISLNPEDITKGCIGDISLSNIYSLKVLKTNIQDESDNWTLFYFMKK